jgi:hypothetical protein
MMKVICLHTLCILDEFPIRQCFSEMFVYLNMFWSPPLPNFGISCSSLIQIQRAPIQKQLLQVWYWKVFMKLQLKGFFCRRCLQFYWIFFTLFCIISVWVHLIIYHVLLYTLHINTFNTSALGVYLNNYLND